MTDQHTPGESTPSPADSPTPAERSGKPPWFWWAIGAGIVAVGLIGYAVLTGSSTVAVPQTVGMEQSAAETAIKSASLRVGTVSEVDTIAVTPGIVLAQTPAATQEVAEGSAVDLKVSKIPMVQVPDIVGETLSAADEVIAVAGLQPGEVTYAYDAKVSPGEVISQQPEPSTEVTIASFVDMTVSKGEQQAQVPSVVGLSENDAKEVLTAAGYKTSSVKAESSSVPAGDVIKQSPAAGSVTDPGITVTLTVSVGVAQTPPPAESPEPTTPPSSVQPPAPSEPSSPQEPPATEKPSTLTSVPDVVGMGVVEAIKSLRGASLKVEFEFGPSEQYLLKVSAQDPSAGTQVDRGTSVTITIGLPSFLFGGVSPQPLPSAPDTGAQSSPPAPQVQPSAPSGVPSSTP